MVTVQSHLENAISVFKSGSLSAEVNAGKQGVEFTPGVCFYFRCEDLEKHAQKVHDGFLPIKVKGEVKLADYVYDSGVKTS